MLGLLAGAAAAIPSALGGILGGGGAAAGATGATGALGSLLGPISSIGGMLAGGGQGADATVSPDGGQTSSGKGKGGLLGGILGGAGKALGGLGGNSQQQQQKPPVSISLGGGGGTNFMTGSSDVPQNKSMSSSRPSSISRGVVRNLNSPSEEM